MSIFMTFAEDSLRAGASIAGAAAVAAKADGSIDLGPAAWAAVFKFVLQVTLTFGVTIAFDRYVLIKLKTEKSHKAIFDLINDKLKEALIATGGQQINLAAELAQTVSLHLGPLLTFITPISKALKDLEDVGKGKIKQEMICTRAKYRCCGAEPTPTITVSTPSASASAAGTGAAAASASATGPVAVPGGTLMPARHDDVMPCDCGAGKLRDVPASAGGPTYERAMTTAEQSASARRAIEQFAQLWTKSTVLQQLRAIDRTLTNAKRKKPPKKD